MTERATPGEELLQIGRSIVQRIRSETNNEYGHFSGQESEDVFVTLYLTKRDVCVPEHLLGDDILVDIRAMFSGVFDSLREELRDRLNLQDFLWLAVDPSYEDSTFSVLCTDEQVLLLYWTKAWNFYWPNEETMALDLARLYEAAAKRLIVAPERRDEPGV